MFTLIQENYNIDNHLYIECRKKKFDGFYVNKELWEFLEFFHDAFDKEMIPSKFAPLFQSKAYLYNTIKKDNLAIDIAFTTTKEDRKVRLCAALPIARDDFTKEEFEFMAKIHNETINYVDEDVRESMKMIQNIFI